VQLQRTIAATLIYRGCKESGAIQWIQMYPGRHVMFQNVVSLKVRFFLLRYFNPFCFVMAELQLAWYCHAKLEAND